MHTYVLGVDNRCKLLEQKMISPEQAYARNTLRKQDFKAKFMIEKTVRSASNIKRVKNHSKHVSWFSTKELTVEWARSRLLRKML
jgi:hypothetical protein